MADIDSGLVLDFLSPETVRRGEMELHTEMEGCRTNNFQELPHDSSGPSCDLGVTGHGEPNIGSQDKVVVISDVKVCSGMFCLLNFSCPGNSVRLPVVCRPHWMGMAHSRGAVWDLGGVCMPRLMVCCDCLGLITLYQNILLCDHGQACLPALYLKDIGCWRTIDWELGSLGTVHMPYQDALSVCLHVGQIKSWWMVIMLGWVINTLFLQCVGVRGPVRGVAAPVGVAIQVTGLSDLVGGSMGRSEWLLLTSRWPWLWCRQISASGLTVVCPSGFGIGHKGRAIVGSSSLDTAPVTGSLLFNAPVCRLAVYCTAVFSSWVLFGGCDCIWLAVF